MKKSKYFLSIILIIFISCSKKQEDLNDLVVGRWVPYSVFNSNYISCTVYFPDSTYYSFHGDYDDKGFYFIKDSVFNKVSNGDTMKFKVLELTDSIFKLENIESGFVSKSIKWK